MDLDSKELAPNILEALARISRDHDKIKIPPIIVQDILREVNSGTD